MDGTNLHGNNDIDTDGTDDIEPGAATSKQLRYVSRILMLIPNALYQSVVDNMRHIIGITDDQVKYLKDWTDRSRKVRAGRKILMHQNQGHFCNSRMHCKSLAKLEVD